MLPLIGSDHALNAAVPDSRAGTLLIHLHGGVEALPAHQNGGGAREGRQSAGCATVFGVDVKALVWLGIPVDDVATAAGFFAGTLALDPVFEDADTVELSAGNGDKIQLFGPGHRYFDLCRAHGVAMLPLFEVADVDQARAALSGAGIELLGAVESDAAWRWFLARGPDGNLYSFGARQR